MTFPTVEIFVDGGGNHYRSVEKYLKNFPKFDQIYVFEPNPIFRSSYDASNLIFVEKAIWTSNCTRPFYVSKDDKQCASSLLFEKLCKVDSQLLPYWHDDPIDVECIDFSEWIRDNIKPHHNLTVKLDIEGAEYDVLSKMIRDGTIGSVKKLYVEFHQTTVKSKAASHDQLIASLRENGVEPLYWD